MNIQLFFSHKNDEIYAYFFIFSVYRAVQVIKTGKLHIPAGSCRINE